ncbi:MAG: DUF58 domain-containing protein [Treponemataceae bacterium]|nr:DUF58 domain-containing protein [Treponemataceae bacterium]HOJ99145.1 DUF58 domain-containing protein [Termitinemataceae bacterium]HOM23218.1 DUF58 domain-containing protein [Termitinemataceae bacterium]HPQ00404.1 DUF58 domain-containing protein [Termitinemataceae bacterium]
MKYRGRLLILFLILIAFFAPLSLLRTLALFGAFLLFFNLLYLFFLEQGVRIRRKDPVVRIYKNQLARIELEIQNRSWFPMLAVVLSDGISTFDAHGQNRQKLDILPKSKRVIHYTFRGTERGRWELGPVRIELRDFLGMQSVTVESPERGHLVVYPAMVPLSFHPGDGSPVGELPSPFRIHEDPGRFRSLREYQVGDDLRRINWKSTAHVGKLIATEYESSMDSPLLVILNIYGPSFPLKERYLYTEWAISYGASLVSTATMAGQMTGLVSNGLLPDREERLYIPPAHESATPILDSLASLRISEDDEGWDLFHRALVEVPYRAHVAYVGVFGGEKLQELVLLSRRKGCTFAVYIVGATAENLRELHQWQVPVVEMEYENG